MAAKKYYEILGVTKQATDQEIKKAYKKSHVETRKEYDDELQYGAGRQSSASSEDWQSAYSGRRE